MTPADTLFWITDLPIPEHMMDWATTTEYAPYCFVGSLEAAHTHLVAAVRRRAEGGARIRGLRLRRWDGRIVEDVLLPAGTP